MTDSGQPMARGPSRLHAGKVPLRIPLRIEDSDKAVIFTTVGIFRMGSIALTAMANPSSSSNIKW